MRIVHVTDVYLPRLGGIELHVHDLADQQRRRGHDVLVLTAGDASPRRGDDVPVARLGRAAWARPLPDVVAAADVVHCHSSIVSPLAWAAARAADRVGVPTVVTMHSVVPHGAVVNDGLRAVVALAGPGVTWAAVSGVAARSLQPLVPRPVLVLPNGIDPAAWRPGPARTRRPGEPLTIVTVGRFAARKRMLPLVDVLAEVRRRLHPAIPLHAVLAGDGPQRSAVRDRLARLGIDRWVELPGRLSHPEVLDLYTRADAFLAPATLESFGLAALEARCAGLPVIARSQAGVSEFVRDGVEGLLVNDDTEMARRTADLLADPVTSARISQFNRSVPTTLDWDSVLDRCLDVYATAAGVPVLDPAGTRASRQTARSTLALSS